jgi:predicted ATP-dependent endonuclease of OLD family
MLLQKITIKNYRSIDNLIFDVKDINQTYTYTLLGINESGKSNFLKCLSLFDKSNVTYPIDYYDSSKNIELIFEYNLTEEDWDIFIDVLKTKYNFPNELALKASASSVAISVSFEPTKNPEKVIAEAVNFKTKVFKDYTLNGAVPVIKDVSNKDQIDFNIEEYFQKNLKDFFWSYAHYVVFWQSSPEFLILDEIDLKTFAAKPKEVSIPLMNCFKLAGFETNEIEVEISNLDNFVNLQNLQDKLGDSVTSHINRIWPEHPIVVKFQINNNKIALLIEDKGVKYNVKTTGQRSDGFRQFISFLLTLSAESAKEQLLNTILLLDEPETHLHPQAQINLKDELIKITSSSSNNIVFFATHSNYMIDKSNIDRCFKVVKEKNQKTILNQIPKTNTSFSEVNYEVFEIPTNDYHNELYGFLEDTKADSLETLPKSKEWKNELHNKTEKVSLCKYIRNSIHHPENTSNPPFTDKELRTSIETMRKLR